MIIPKKKHIVSTHPDKILLPCFTPSPLEQDTTMSFSLDLRYQICLQPIELPVFNPIALELLQLLADPDTDIIHITETIHKDPALAVQILKLANSPAYAGRARMETIKDSVNRLGARLITNLAMAASQSALHTSAIPEVNGLMQDLWQHSYACALGCRSLANSTGHNDLSENAYLAGLLHDIGKLYLLKAMERIYLNGEISFNLDRETVLDVFSDMHVEQGYRLMWHWNIPPMYCDVVAKHHCEFCNSDDILTTIVRLVNFNSMQYNLNLYPQVLQPCDVSAEIAVLNASESALKQLEKDMCSSSAA